MGTCYALAMESAILRCAASVTEDGQASIAPKRFAPMIVSARVFATVASASVRSDSLELTVERKSAQMIARVLGNA